MPRTRMPFAASLLTLVAAILVAAPEGAHAEQSRPHVLLILTDDLGWRDLGCQGNPRLRTPHIDALAADGARFAQAYAAAPVCSPTRAAILTGLAPARLGITQHGADQPQFWPEDRRIQPPPTRRDLPLEAVTLAERLRTAGYATGFFGKWHVGEPKAFWPTAQGFDVNVGGCGLGGPPTYFDPYRIPALPDRRGGEYLTDRLAEEAIGFVREHAAQPTLVCLWTYNPHYPFEAPDDLIQHYVGREGPGLKNPVYGAQIEATDRAVGRVLEEYQRLGLFERSLILFASDNGGWTGATDNQPLRAGKGYLYEGGLRTPLIIRWPGVTTPATVVETPVVSMDLTATILDAAGVPISEAQPLDGQSLRPLLRGEAWSREALYFHYPHFAFHRQNRPGAAIRRGNEKLILRFDDQSVELYDLQQDPGEATNFAAERPASVELLRRQLELWLMETRAGLPTPRPTP